MTKSSPSATTDKRAEAEKSCAKRDDCGQIDCIIGSYGKYQFMIFLFKILIGATSALNNLGVSFYAPTSFVSFWCADLEQQQQLVANGQFAHTNLSRPLNVGPLNYEPNNNSEALAHLERQHLHQLPATSGRQLSQVSADKSNWTIGQVLSEFLHNSERERRHSGPSETPLSLRQECTFLSPHDNQHHKCTTFKYDTGIWMSTIIDEWDLVCDRSLFISMSQSLYMAGFIVAYLLFGQLSDRFGRWNSLLLGSVIEIVSGFGCAFSNSVAQFMLFRFLLGLGNAGRSSSSYLIMIEWTGPKWRMHISTLGSLGWVISYCAMPWLAKFYLHFRHMQLFVCFYELLFVVWLLFLPESPRWLLTRKQFDRAHQVLLRAAKFNGLIKTINYNNSNQSDSSSSTGDNCSSSSSESIQMTSANLLRPSNIELSSTQAALKKLETGSSILAAAAAGGSFARKRINSISLMGNSGNSIPVRKEHHLDQEHYKSNNNNAHHYHQQVTQQQQPHQLVPSSRQSIILAPAHEVATHVEVSVTNQKLQVDQLVEDKPLEAYSLREFDLRFAKLVEVVSKKEFTNNEDRLSFVDLLRWQNLRKYTLILAFAWCCNSFIYYGIALRVGDLSGTNLFVSFSLAGATELPSILFTLIFMKFLPRRLTNMLMFSIIFLLSALQVPLKFYDVAWLQQTSMILAKLFNSCSFTCILYQTMELFPTSIRQTAYSSCALAGRIGSILAPFVKELSLVTNNLVPPVLYAVLSLLEIVLIRRLPETQGSDMPDTLLEAEKFKGTKPTGNKAQS